MCIRDRAYTVQGVRYIRESYVSYPENCMVMVLKTEDGTAFSFDCLLGRCHNATDEVEKVDEHTICFTVDGGQEGISFAAALCAKAVGGFVRVIGEHLLVRDVQEAYLYLDIETSFREADYRKVCLDRIRTAAVKEEADIRALHLSLIHI